MLNALGQVWDSTERSHAWNQGLTPFDLFTSASVVAPDETGSIPSTKA